MFSCDFKLSGLRYFISPYTFLPTEKGDLAKSNKSLVELYLKLWSYSFPWEWQKHFTNGKNMIIFLIYVESFGSTKNIFLTQCVFEQVGTLFGRRDNHIEWSELQASKNRSLGRSSSHASIPTHILGEIKWTISLNGFSKTLHIWKDFHLIMPFLYISYLSVNATDINHTWMRGKNSCRDTN